MNSAPTDASTWRNKRASAMKLLQIFFALALAVSLSACATTSNKVFNVRDAGAKGDGLSFDTKAIQEALDGCGAAGGGTVVLPKGTYLSKPLTIHTKTTLRLEKGATSSWCG